ncbi:MAG: FtsX-like permease family protein [Actinomycetota bacterium]|nr:FtsX-like permease family protein [Actinomycetota bacterium]
MSARYVWRELLRNPRRTLASLAGVALGVGLFSAVLFFIDGSGASMTQRALAPLAIDQQRVLAAPLGGNLGITEQLGATRGLRRGEQAPVRLVVANDGAVPANEVVVSDLPASPLQYVSGSMRRDDRPLADVEGQSPLAQGPAQIGLNIGTVAPGHRVTFSFTVRAGMDLAAGVAHPQATISSREALAPIAANAPPPASLQELARAVARVPGVASADGLGFVDLASGSIAVAGTRITTGARLFAFDETYRRHYPAIRLVSGRLEPGHAVLSVEAARVLRAGPGAMVAVTLPGRSQPLLLPVGGVADLSQSKPLFYSRKSSNLEDFLYLPQSVVVDPATFRDRVLTAYREAAATRGSRLLSTPLLELDIRIARTRLHADPATAFSQSQAVARAVGRIAPGQDYIIDNASNTLQVARDDSVVAKRMFLFLGLPGALLAAFLASFAGAVLAGAQRREHALLRLRGAHRGHLLRMLAIRSTLLAGAGSLLGTVGGFMAALAVLGSTAMSEASSGRLVVSAAVSVALGVLTTALALYIPGRRALGNQIADERVELAPTSEPAWRRRRLDLALLLVAAVGEIVALNSGAFDAQPGSVYKGHAVSLPTRLLALPIVAWVAGVLVAVRVIQLVLSRLHVPAPPIFGPLVLGTLVRSVRRRSWALVGVIVCIGLVIAFGTALSTFTATYDRAKANEARYLVGSDIRVTPSVLSTRPHPASFAKALQVPGISAVTPAVFSVENAVLTGPYTSDRQSLAAVEPLGYLRVATPADRFFVGLSARDALTALARNPRGMLLEAGSAEAFQLKVGDEPTVLFARGTKNQQTVALRVLGLFRRMPGFPEGATVVTNLSEYEAATHLTKVDAFIASTTSPGPDGLRAAVGALEAGPGQHDHLNLQTTSTVLGKDQSSLTALNVHGLVSIDGTFTLMMAAAALGIFVFGLILERRREYITMRAQGAPAASVRNIVLGETAIVGLCGLLGGVAVGVVMGALLVHVLQPLFILAPSLAVSPGRIGVLAGLAITAIVLSALAASMLLRRLRPTELLRET